MGTIGLVFGWIAQATLLSFCIAVSPAPWEYREILVSSLTSDECVGGVTPETSADIVVRFANPSAVPAETLRALFSEAARIWRAGGVVLHELQDASSAVRKSQSSLEAHRISTTLDVTFSEEAPVLHVPEGRLPLAAIRFVDGKPTTHIAVFPSEGERLLSLFRSDDRLLAERPVGLRNFLLGRMLGRALAHELGHFLFRSSGHTRGGLMQANLRTDFLLGESERPFRVDPAWSPCKFASVDNATGDHLQVPAHR
jgi:hypothetical protein